MVEEIESFLCYIHILLDKRIDIDYTPTLQVIRNTIVSNNITSSTQHPVLTNVVYWDPYVQPSNNTCLGSLLVEHYGRIDAPTVIRNITSVLKTGNTLNMVLDYNENAVYIAYSAPEDPQGPIEAFNRVHTRIDMAKLFAEPVPTIEDE